MSGVSQGKIEIIPVLGMPIVKQGDNIAKLIYQAVRKSNLTLYESDILVVAETVIAKSEGSTVALATVKPGTLARIIAERTGKDPRIAEIILRETKEIVRLSGSHIITETKHGWICANSGVDVSNVSGGSVVATLPEDADASARQIREGLKELAGKVIGVIISDTFGRPFRMGQSNVAVGIAGLKPILDRRGDKDLFGYVLRIKEIAVADEIAAAAELVMGEAAEGIPVAIVRGYIYKSSEEALIRDLIRPHETDLFL